MDYHAILVLLCIFSGATAQFNVSPSNTVVLDGTADTTLSCTPETPTNFMAWSRIPAGTVIVNACGVVPGYELLYSVVHDPATGQCDLVVINATSSLAGQYRCLIVGASIDPNRDAELVVLASEPVCTQSPQYLYDDDRLDVGCSVSFSGNIPPPFEWDNNGQNLIISNTSGSTFVNSSGYIIPPLPAPGATIKPVSCNIGFQPSPLFIWNSTSVPIQYSPTNLNITGGDFTDSLYLGTVISCSADAYPAPRYEWQNATDNNNTLGSEQTYTLTVPGNYTLQCVVNNTIQNPDGVGSWESSETITQFVMVDNSTEPPPTTTTTESQGKSCSENPGCIVPAIVVPIVSVAIIITIICCCCCCNSSCPCYGRCQRCRPRNCPCDNKGERESDGSGSQGSADRMTSPQTQTPTYTQHPNQGYNGNYQPDVTYSQPHHNPAGSRPYNASQNNPPRSPPPPLVSPEGIIYADLATCNPGSRRPVVAPSETVYASIATA